MREQRRGRVVAATTFVCALALPCLSGAQTAGPATKNPLTIIDSDRVDLTARIEAVVGAFGSSGTWFGLDSLDPDASFDDLRHWAEGWLEPGLDGRIGIVPGIEAYGGASVGVGGTWGSDPFDVRNASDVGLENAFGGLRLSDPAGRWKLDLSSGKQDYGVGTGMLLWQGAGNGFERGGLALLPRRAWSNASLAKFSFSGLSLEGFYLDANELDSNDTHTRLAGAVAQYRWSAKGRVGLSGMKVLESRQFYPLPSNRLSDFVPGIEDGRDGLMAWQGFAEVDGADFGLANAWARAEFAFEHNGDIDQRAYAVYGEVGYRFASVRFAPAISYGFAAFSGDDPDTTTRYERFDPLFYGNGLDNWWFGANGSFAFLNSNTLHHRVTLQMVLSQKDFVKVQYVHTRADQLFSPIQFGQVTRTALSEGGLVLVNGVAESHLADELYGEWAHVFTPHITFALWGSWARPADGLRRLPGADTESWSAAGALLTVRY